MTSTWRHDIVFEDCPRGVQQVANSVDVPRCFCRSYIGASGIKGSFVTGARYRLGRMGQNIVFLRHRCDGRSSLPFILAQPNLGQEDDEQIQ
jgi:hypothetical protein